MLHIGCGPKRKEHTLAALQLDYLVEARVNFDLLVSARN